MEGVRGHVSGGCFLRPGEPSGNVLRLFKDSFLG